MDRIQQLPNVFAFTCANKLVHKNWFVTHFQFSVWKLSDKTKTINVIKYNNGLRQFQGNTLRFETTAMQFYIIFKSNQII